MTLLKTPPTRIASVALAGNPNSGKTTLFNAITGLRQKVGNYPGVTVERREGWVTLDDGHGLSIHDLPGCYSLTSRSPEEAIARDALLGRLEAPAPDAIVVVLDAANLERNLYLCLQLRQLGRPLIVALNMMDVAEAEGLETDVEALQKTLGVPVVPVVARTGKGVPELLAVLGGEAPAPVEEREWSLSGECEDALATVAVPIQDQGRSRGAAELLAESLLFSPELESEAAVELGGAELPELLKTTRAGLEAAGVDIIAAPIEARYAWIREHAARCQSGQKIDRVSNSERVDRILTHRVLGPLTFLTMTAILFQLVFKLTEAPTDLIDGVMGRLAELAKSPAVFGDGLLGSLVGDGMVAGVGAVVVFLPQILCLFLFLSLLEDCGYMARAAFIMDRIMRRVGLSGRAFIPILTSYGCAVPGIMAARTIESPRDRLATILVAPLTTCSARLPVYVLLIALMVKDEPVPGVPFFHWPGLVMFGLYLLGIVGVLVVSLALKGTILPATGNTLVFELPSYRLPSPRAVALTVLDRGKIFLARAGTVILTGSVLLWALMTWPGPPAETVATFDARRVPLQRQLEQLEAKKAAQEAERKARAAGASEAAGDKPSGETAEDKAIAAVTEQLRAIDSEQAGVRLRGSFAGQIGRGLEPVMKPLGYDWKISIGLLGSFAAREVFVSTMGIVYNVGGDVDEEDSGLRGALRSERGKDGEPIYSLPTVLSLLVFYVFACQCVSTLAVCRRETASWRWPLFMLAYMTVLAWVSAFITYRVALALSGS